MKFFNVITVLEQFRIVCNCWDRSIFIKEVFGKDESELGSYELQYYHSKWLKFRDAPQLFYFELDEETGAQFIRSLMKYKNGPDLEN